MFWLLVACGVPESADSADSLVSVSVAPIYLSRSWPYPTLLDGGDSLKDSYGPVYVVNTGPEPVLVEALATSTVEQVNFDAGPESWMDVSPAEDVSMTLQPGQQSQIDYLALGRSWDGDELDRGIYTFDLTVTVDGIDTAIRAELILQTAE